MRNVGVIVDLAGAFYRAEAAYAPTLREVGLADGLSVFEHPEIVAWRELPDRENCTLDATLSDGRALRFHVKRWRRGQALKSQGPADEERGVKLLNKAGIPSVPFAAAGVMPDGRGFVITEDLTALGYDDAEKLIERGVVKFDAVRDALADVAAKLHAANLRHRDMYLCHFFVKADAPAMDVRLIDAARVSHRPKWFGRRWVIKDLAQFWYSTTKLAISDAQRDAWLRRYCEQTGDDFARTKAAIVRKSNTIARHDAKLERNQPTRNVSIPRTTGGAGA